MCTRRASLDRPDGPRHPGTADRREPPGAVLQRLVAPAGDRSEHHVGEDADPVPRHPEPGEHRREQVEVHEVQRQAEAPTDRSRRARRHPVHHERQHDRVQDRQRLGPAALHQRFAVVTDLDPIERAACDLCLVGVAGLCGTGAPPEARVLVQAAMREAAAARDLGSEAADDPVPCSRRLVRTRGRPNVLPVSGLHVHAHAAAGVILSVAAHWNALAPP